MNEELKLLTRARLEELQQLEAEVKAHAGDEPLPDPWRERFRGFRARADKLSRSGALIEAYRRGR